MAKPPSPVRDAKEAAIIEAARATFLAHGYDAASMDQIALAASVSKRTVYNRFRSKEELFAAAIEETCRSILPVDIAAIEASLSTEEFVRAMARAFLEGILEPEALALRRIAAFEAGRNPSLGRSYLEHGPAYMAAAFAPILERTAKREGIRIDDVETAIYQLGALISEPLYTEVLLGAVPKDLSAAIDRQIEQGVKAFWRIYGDQSGLQSN
ncbi:MAG: TetR/AcrR family transcriptional regulator [Pseudomonadota bacterium]